MVHGAPVGVTPWRVTPWRVTPWRVTPWRVTPWRVMPGWAQPLAQPISGKRIGGSWSSSRESVRDSARAGGALGGRKGGVEARGAAGAVGVGPTVGNAAFGGVVAGGWDGLSGRAESDVGPIAGQRTSSCDAVGEDGGRAFGPSRCWGDGAPSAICGSARAGWRRGRGAGESGADGAGAGTVGRGGVTRSGVRDGAPAIRCGSAIT
jgi:hypothetical protein